MALTPPSRLLRLWDYLMTPRAARRVNRIDAAKRRDILGLASGVATAMGILTTKTRRCSACGADNPTRAPFCMECGADFAGDKLALVVICGIAFGFTLLWGAIYVSAGIWARNAGTVVWVLGALALTVALFTVVTGTRLRRFRVSIGWLLAPTIVGLFFGLLSFMLAVQSGER